MGDDENACVRNIVKEIMRECLSKKIKINKNFVTYLTKLLLVNPNWGIDDDFFNQRQNVQQFVKYFMEAIVTNQDDPKVVTLKIQFYYSCNMEHMEKATEMNMKELRNRMTEIREDIININLIRGKPDSDILFKKVVYYITLFSGLGNPLKPKVYEEALVALKSILNEDELREFAKLPRHEKLQQLDQMARVVAGIRLLNKDCEKGGEGIANLPDLLDKAIIVIRQSTEKTLLMIMEKVNLLTTIVDKSYVIRKSLKVCQLLLQLPDEAIKYNIDIEYIKDMLILFRQYELLVRQILEELDRVHEKTEIIFINMEKMLRTIHDTVQMKIAIPVGVVFPLFEQLWAIWEQFQNVALVLSRFSIIMGNLETYCKQTNYEPEYIEPIIGESPSLTDAERLSQTAHLKLVSENESVTVIPSDTIKNIYNIKLEYLGFCCWKLKETDGALIPGNPSMGIIRYAGKNYVFSCVEGFKEFMKEPQRYVNCVLDLARRKPQLINFFQLKESLESVSNIERLFESREKIKMCEDKSIQTIIHTEESRIKPKYQWNIWELKKEALTMANISSAVTVSTQTNKTGSKNSIRSQTYNTKMMECQTRKHSHSNVPKPSVFIYGLRGRRDNQQFKIDLTRPVDER